MIHILILITIGVGDIYLAETGNANVKSTYLSAGFSFGMAVAIIIDILRGR